MSDQNGSESVDECYMCGAGGSLKSLRVDGAAKPFCPSCRGLLEESGRLENRGTEVVA